MLIRRGFKYELRPNGRQAKLLAQFCGCARYVYNRTLSLEKSLYKQDKKHSFNFYNCCKRLPKWKKKHCFLKDCPSQTLQCSLKDLERAYKNFFSKLSNFPKYKKKFQQDSIHFPQEVKLDEENCRVKLPKLGWIKYTKSRHILGTIKNVTVSRRGDKWDISVQTEYEIEVTPNLNLSKVGLDVGIARFVTLSDGSFVKPLNSLKTNREKLAKLQRKLARQKKGSKNSKKTKRKISRLHEHIANSRRDFCHKTSTTIAQNHSVVYVEDLKVKNMSASAKGTVENPGKNVKQKSGLNRCILNQGWGMFFSMLAYKLVWRGGKLIKVPPKNTSRTCPQCGFVSKHNRETQANFTCLSCGFHENADYVGAINILRAGQARLACQVSGAVRPPATGTHRSNPNIKATAVGNAVGTPS